MKKVSKFIGICLTMLCVLCVGCEKIGILKSELSGSTWEYEFNFENSITETNYIQTIRFTSDKTGSYSKTGTWKVYSPVTKKWTSGTYDDHDGFTYIYSPELKEGVYTYSNGKQVVFFISDDYKSLSAGITYIRK